MKQLTQITLFILFLGQWGLAQSSDLGSIPHLKLQFQQSRQKNERVQAANNGARLASSHGMQLVYREGAEGLTWAQLSLPGVRKAKSGVSFSIRPQFSLQANGRSGAGLEVNTRYSKHFSLRHSSQFGRLESHRTTLTVAPGQVLSFTVRRDKVGTRLNKRLGPQLRLGKKARVWYGKSLNQGNDLVLVTGNFRF